MNPENVSVSVTDSISGEGVNGVQVTLTGTGSNEYAGTTGSAGGCTIQMVPPGEYVVNASVTGYDDYSGSFTVSSENKNLVFVMNAT